MREAYYGNYMEAILNEFLCVHDYNCCFAWVEYTEFGIREKFIPPPGGLEPPTFRLTAERANQLRHGGCLMENHSILLMMMYVCMYYGF